MTRTNRGFTLVEILMVISLLGILIAIALVSWSSYIGWSGDRAREGDMRTWASTFDLYKSRFYVYPAMSTSVAAPYVGCLGKFASSSSRCGAYTDSTPGAYYNDTTADSMITQVQKVGNTPVNSGPAISGKFAGPLVYVWQNSDTSPITVNADILGYFVNNCPSDFTDVTTTSPYNTVIPSGGAHLCRLTKQFTYSPS